MGLFRAFFGNAGKPEGRFAKAFTKGMNSSSHARLADWGLNKVRELHLYSICDMGCGGGRNIGEMLKMFPEAKVMGRDLSDISVEVSCEYNANAIRHGRCEIKQGTVASLDLGDEVLDLATAFETIYFWPGLEECFTEVNRTLKPGGKFLIVNEADGTGASSVLWEKIVGGGMYTYTKEEIIEALKAAGFKGANVYHHIKKPWIAVVAEK
jgi:SAM-dependent methyltransferase